jgi:DNA-binding LytR/AlgR family response regulator
MSKAKNKYVNIVIIEDEIHNSRLLQGLIDKLRPAWNIAAILESIEESVKWFNSNSAPDLVLMDIQLSDGICFSIFEKVKLPTSCRVIFTTAYDEYAIRAFEVNSIDYLLKPIEEPALNKAFQKFEELIEVENENFGEVEYTKLVNTILQGKREYRTRFLISAVNTYQKLEAEDIAYFYSENKLTFAVTNDGKEYTLDYNLEQLESELNPKMFFRVNRKVIAHINSVIKINNESGGKLLVELNPLTDFDIVVSRLKASDFKVWMGK